MEAKIIFFFHLINLRKNKDKTTANTTVTMIKSKMIAKVIIKHLVELHFKISLLTAIKNGEK